MGGEAQPVQLVEDELDGFFQVEEGISRETLVRLYSQVMDGARKVFAPFGIPGRLLLYCPRVLLMPRHTAVFERVLDAVSEQVYLKEGLTETAVAVAMHHYVDAEGDAEIRKAVMAMQSALNLIWDPETVVELPGDSSSLPIKKEDLLSLATKIGEAFKQASSSVEELGSAGKKAHAVQLWKLLESVSTQPWEVQEACCGVHALDHEVRLKVEEVTGMGLAQDELLTAIRAMIDAEEPVEPPAPPSDEGEDGEKPTPPLLGEALANFVKFCDEVEEAEEKLGQGQITGALALYKEALQMEEEGLLSGVPGSALARVYHQRATCYIAMGEAEEAMEDLSAAIERDKGCAAAYQLRGQLKSELGASTEEVVEDYCKAYALEGLKLPSELQELEKALKEESRHEALSILQDKRRKQREGPVKLPARWLIESYFASFASERADGSIRKEVAEEGPEDTPADRNLRDALELRLAGRYEEAWDSCRRALTSAPFSCDAMEGLAQNQYGSFLYLIGDLESAEEALSNAASRCEGISRVNSLIKLGEVLSDMGRLEEGLSSLDDAVAEAQGLPDECDALLHRGQIHLTHDDVVSAVNDLRRAVALDGPGSYVPPVAWACLGTALFKLEEGAPGGQAESTLEDALKAHPGSFEVLLYYGDILAEKGNIVSSIARFAEAHAIDVTSPLPYVHAARAYMTVRDLKLAEKHLKKALELDPTCSASFLDLGQLEVQRGRSVQALECFEAGMAQARYLPEVQDALVFRKLAQLHVEQQQQLGAGVSTGAS